MSRPADIVANMVRGWHGDPTGWIAGTRPDSVSAAFWSGGAPEVRTEVTAEPEPDTHILSLMLSSFDAEDVFDGRQSYSGPHRPGMVNLVLAGQRPRGVVTGPFSVLHIYIPTSLPSGLAVTLGESAVELVDPRCAVDRAVERLGRAVLAELRAGLPLARLRMDALGLELAVHLLRRHSSLAGTGRPRRREPAPLATWRLKRVLALVEARLGDDPSLAEMAAAAGVSAYHFLRAFRASTGQTPHAWLAARRVERARALLARYPARPIAEIALDTGFCSQAHMTATFRRLIGITPGAVRRALHD